MQKNTDCQNLNFWRLVIHLELIFLEKPIKTDRQELILAYLHQNESITNKEARETLGLAESTTKRVLKTMVDEGTLIINGSKKQESIV